jgi:hypothetical protein
MLYFASCVWGSATSHAKFLHIKNDIDARLFLTIIISCFFFQQFLMNFNWILKMQMFDGIASGNHKL